ncbi:MAG: hypothetical protein ACO2OZ_11655 [Acidilobaceae archaeon]
MVGDSRGSYSLRRPLDGGAITNLVYGGLIVDHAGSYFKPRFAPRRSSHNYL